MSQWLTRSRVHVLVSVLGALVLVPAAAQGEDPPCDFNDAFYRANGLDPCLVGERRGGETADCGCPGPFVPTGGAMCLGDPAPGDGTKAGLCDDKGSLGPADFEPARPCDVDTDCNFNRICNAPPLLTVFATPDPACSVRDPDRRDIRILETTGGFNKVGELIYYSVMSSFFPDSFTKEPGGDCTDPLSTACLDAAGEHALDLARKFVAYLFPRDPDGDGVVILAPQPPNRRQDNIFDTKGGYFDDNPAGLWTIAFVNYTPAAYSTQAGQEELARLAELHGTSTDGTGIMRTVDEIESLVSKGLAVIRTRRESGKDGFPWVV
jgi:hypothetical protein